MHFENRTEFFSDAFEEERGNLLMELAAAIAASTMASREEMVYMTNYGREGMAQLILHYFAMRLPDNSFQEQPTEMETLVHILTLLCVEILLHPIPNHEVLGVYRELHGMMETLLEGAWFE